MAYKEWQHFVCRFILQLCKISYKFLKLIHKETSYVEKVLQNAGNYTFFESCSYL